jgi:hypothetical protein
MELTHTLICQRALTAIGARPIRDINEDTERARACKHAYDTMLDALLDARRWSFAYRLYRLSQINAPAPPGWLYSYQLPAARIGAPRVVYDRAELDRPIDTYELAGGSLLANAPQVWARCLTRPEPRDWTGGFVQLAVTAIAAALAMPVRRAAGLQERLLVEAFGTNASMGRGGLFKLAADADFAAEPDSDLPAGRALLGRTAPADEPPSYRF